MSFTSQFKALLKKNFILLRRDICGSLCELLFPLIMIGLAIFLRHIIKDKTIEKKDYLNDCGFTYYYDENTKLDYQLFTDNTPDWMGSCKANPFASCLMFERPLVGFVVQDNDMYNSVNDALLGDSGGNYFFNFSAQKCSYGIFF